MYTFIEELLLFFLQNKITVGKGYEKDTSILIRDGIVHIMHIWLPKEFQKLGLATRLFEVLDKQSCNGVKRLFVDAVSNPNLRRLLEKHNYTPCNYTGLDKDVWESNYDGLDNDMWKEL